MNAIKIKNQSKVTRAVNWLIKYNEADNLETLLMAMVTKKHGTRLTIDARVHSISSLI